MSVVLYRQLRYVISVSLSVTRDSCIASQAFLLDWLLPSSLADLRTIPGVFWGECHHVRMRRVLGARRETRLIGFATRRSWLRTPTCFVLQTAPGEWMVSLDYHRT